MRELARALDDAVADGRVASLDVATPGGLQPDEITLLRNRLFVLGYVDKDNERGVLDAELEASRRDFDREAGLSGDDPRASWVALDVLVSFEHEDGIGQWFTDLDRRAALRRAAHLRLFCLGLSPLGPRPRDTGDDLERGLAAFVRVLQLFDPSYAPPLEFGPIELKRLFGHDDWVDRFAQLGETVRFVQPDGADHRDKIRNVDLVTNFVLAVARIELWLHGYSTLPRPRVASDATGISAAVSRGMIDFWEDQPDELRPNKRERERVDGRFFARLQAIAREAGEGDANHEAIVQQLEKDRDLQKRVSDEVRSLGARIWDGLKRAGRWLGALFRRVATNIRQLARNLARLMSAGAARVWAIVRNSVRAVVETAAFTFRATMKGSDPLHLLVRHDGDFDIVLLLNSNCDSSRARNISDLLRLRALLAEVGMRVTGYISELLRAALKTVTAGWLALLLVLYRAGDTVVALAHDSDVAGRLLGEIELL